MCCLFSVEIGVPGTMLAITAVIFLTHAHHPCTESVIVVYVFKPVINLQCPGNVLNAPWVALLRAGPVFIVKYTHMSFRVRILEPSHFFERLMSCSWDDRFYWLGSSVHYGLYKAAQFSALEPYGGDPTLVFLWNLQGFWITKKKPMRYIYEVLYSWTDVDDAKPEDDSLFLQETRS